MSGPSRVWREPMMWLVIGLPAVVVIASIVVMILISDSGSIDDVDDRVQRTSQIQQVDLSPDLAARELGLSAHLRLTEDVIELRAVSGALPQEPLQLTLAHPARAEQDIAITLEPQDGMWRATAHIARSHDWNLRLAPADGNWRLTGRLPDGQVSALLAPALPNP